MTLKLSLISKKSKGVFFRYASIVGWIINCKQYKGQSTVILLFIYDCDPYKDFAVLTVTGARVIKNDFDLFIDDAVFL